MKNWWNKLNTDDKARYGTLFTFLGLIAALTGLMLFGWTMELLYK